MPVQMIDLSPLKAQEFDYIKKLTAPLEGAVVTSALPVVDLPPEGDLAGGGPVIFPALELRLSDGSKALAIVLRDPEGNGPGFLEVEVDVA